MWAPDDAPSRGRGNIQNLLPPGNERIAAANFDIGPVIIVLNSTFGPESQILASTPAVLPHKGGAGPLSLHTALETPLMRLLA
jgi:hypothetical protein